MGHWQRWPMHYSYHKMFDSISQLYNKNDGGGSLAELLQFGWHTYNSLVVVCLKAEIEVKAIRLSHERRP
jgi:hypothetical protein